MTEHNPQFGCFSLPTRPNNTFVSDIGSDGQPMRQRKVHGKSRYGCRNCKQRKVKCDEEKPCGHCIKRKDKCSLLFPDRASPKRKAPAVKIPSSSTPVTKSRTEATVSKAEVEYQQSLCSVTSLPFQQTSPINLQHLRLLHQFETLTYNTFIFDPEAWKATVLSLAFENTFLMHTVLLLTASHLEHLQPQNHRYRPMIFEHLSQALPGLRIALDTVPGTQNGLGDALMACSCLLLQYSWESPVSGGSWSADYDDEGWETLLGLYSGVRNIVFTFWELKHGGSCFTPWLIYSPKTSIEQYFIDQPIPPDLEACFHHVLTCNKISNDLETDFAACQYAADGLIVIWRALKLGLPALETSDIYLDTARFLFTWPNLHPAGLLNLTASKRVRAQVILLYYFAAVIRLRSERFWWMRRRAVYMFDSIFDRLKDKCDVCTGMAKILRDEEDIQSL